MDPRALAYVFWHRPKEGTSLVEYERCLSAFHASLSAEPPAGFLETKSYRISSPPFAPAEPWPHGYVDWYLVSDWRALGALNEGALAPPHRPSHDAAARRCESATAGAYLHRAGTGPPASVRFELWLSKPRGRPTDEFLAEISPAGPGAEWSVWQRQLSLGPPPEFCGRSRAPPERLPDGARRIELRPVA